MSNGVLNSNVVDACQEMNCDQCPQCVMVHGLKCICLFLDLR